MPANGDTGRVRTVSDGVLAPEASAKTQESSPPAPAKPTRVRSKSHGPRVNVPPDSDTHSVASSDSFSGRDRTVSAEITGGTTPGRGLGGKFGRKGKSKGKAPASGRRMPTAGGVRVPWPHFCGGFLTRSELLAIDGHAYVHMYYKDKDLDTWVPLQVDTNRKKAKMAGMVASGFVVAPSHEKGKFRLEIPRRGDMTKIFLRMASKEPRATTRGDKRPGYREEPYLLFVNDVLVVRDVPGHAIVSNQLANSGYERLQLSCPTISTLPVEELGAVNLLSRAGTAARFDPEKHRFISKQKEGMDPEPASFAFAWCNEQDANRTCLYSSAGFVMQLCHAFASWIKDSIGPKAPPPQLGDESSGPRPFEVVSSKVVDFNTGEELDASNIKRGQIRSETLFFVVRSHLVNLTRTNVTAKLIGVIWQNVGFTAIPMGSYDASTDTQQFTMPKAEIPTFSLARGKYQVTIRYEADNLPAPLSEELVKFTID